MNDNEDLELNLPHLTQEDIDKADVQHFDILIADRDYWKERCQAAEKVNELRNANPWGHSSVGEAVKYWQQLKNKKP